jgi:alginate O-acetyltransferase complex protein AlgI
LPTSYSVCQPRQLDTPTAWLGALAYTLQIYLDFSAYSDMAIGLGMLFGFRFLENFNRPYSAVSLTDFWRRWHISLSRWFRDYLYIPLGGSRQGALRTYVNLTLVFLLCGFWHGANWTFVVWGAYHGLFLVIERMTGLRRISKNRLSGLRRLITLMVVRVRLGHFPQ